MMIFAMISSVGAINQNQQDSPLISQQMMKYCLVALLLVAAYAQEEEQMLFVSNSANTALESTLEDAKFPSKFDTNTAKRADFSKQAADPNYVYAKDGEAEWVFPDATATKARKLWGVGWVSKYNFCVCSDCPKNPATIYVGASSFFVLTYANGTFIGSGWGWSPLTAFTVKLSCGCENRFVLYVYNFWSSPLGAIFYVKQSTKGCYDCQNLGITHYNRKTCECECVNGPPSPNCPCRKPQEWLGYPSCGCMCPKSLLCNWKQYFDMRNCRCACKEVCCPKGFVQHSTLCFCVANTFESSFAAASLSQEQDCIPAVCGGSTSWSQADCRCI